MVKRVFLLWVGLSILLAGCNLPGLPDRALQSQAGEQSGVLEVLSPTATFFLPGSHDAQSQISTAAPEAQPTVPESIDSAPETATGAQIHLPYVSQTALTLWINPALPAALRQSLALPPEIGTTQVADQAPLRLEVGDSLPLTRWVYALVTPFPTLVDAVSSGDLRNAWNGQGGGPFAGHPLLLDESTYTVFSALWGMPAQRAVQVLPAGSLLGTAWDSGKAWALLPFEDLEPRWKVLEVDGQSPLRKEFDLSVYPLAVPVSLVGDPLRVQEAVTLYGNGSAAPLLPPSNRDPGKLTVLAMTGVTALVRATAYTMEQRGVLYPGKDIGDWLRQADITHISNEVPFAQNCPYPNPVQEGVRFCSADKYIQLLEDMGTDVVELTGDHFQDWGQEAMYHTLEMYRERSWGYYGGGEDLQDGRKALLVEHNGNRLAFIGCNGKGGSFAQAGANRPGAVTCDFPWMEAEIARLRSEGYLPVATFQHFEYYTYPAQPNQVRDFRALARAGAVVVSGSQAHQPQAMEFLDQALIHYGLGNLFFDQYDVSAATRQGFIDRHVFYDGRYIGTELLTIQFVDYARPRPMTPDEREDVLKRVFNASGW
jgi:poly-gamma-glutamate synthesis protein (capsule biosynthesis protein)